MRLYAVTIAWLLTSATSSPVYAQGADGYVSLLLDALPHVELSTGERRPVSEFRARLFAERKFEVADHLRITAAAFAEGLIADRDDTGMTRAAMVRPQELHIEALWEKADLRVGLSRVVWGRLDEFLPTDVVNPLDITRFFFEGRNEGRMAVGMIRGRLLPSDRFSVEGIYVPVFRRGRFDQLAERSSPFRIAPDVPIVTRSPEKTLGNGQGGVRASMTTGRVDWSVSAYRGFEPFPTYTFNGMSLVEAYPRFTMFGGDFETVRGQWGIRGEAAAFNGKSFEGGIGVDRRAGEYRVSTNIIVTRETATVTDDGDRTDATVVGSLDRSFARETRSVRALAVYNPGEHSAFIRVIAAFNLRDNLSFETSGGWFTGSGDDSLSRFSTRDFVYARLKVFY